MNAGWNEEEEKLIHACLSDRLHFSIAGLLARVCEEFKNRSGFTLEDPIFYLRRHVIEYSQEILFERLEDIKERIIHELECPYATLVFKICTYDWKRESHSNYFYSRCTYETICSLSIIGKRPVRLHIKEE